MIICNLAFPHDSWLMLPQKRCFLPSFPVLCFTAAVCLWRRLIVSPCRLHTIAFSVYQIVSGRSMSLWGDTILAFNHTLVKPQTRWCQYHILLVHPPSPHPHLCPHPCSYIHPASPILPHSTPDSCILSQSSHASMFIWQGSSGLRTGSILNTVLLEINELMLCATLTYPPRLRDPRSQSRTQKPLRRRQPALIEVLLIGWTFNFPQPEITVIVNQAEWLTLTCFHKVVRHIN